MPELNSAIGIPQKVKLYAYAKVFFPIFVLSIFLSITGQSNLFSIFFGLFVVIGLPAFLYISILFSSISFVVQDGKLTIYSGIVTKKSKVILFDKVQNVSASQGLLMQLFDVSSLSIWTASPEQLNLRAKDGASSNPDGSLILTKDLANWLQDFITKKQVNK